MTVVVTGRQWLRNGTAITGATTNTYLLTPEDDGALITYRVTASKDGLTASADSVAVGPIISSDFPVIEFDGTTFSNVDGNPGQWQQDGVNISGATGPTFEYTEALNVGAIITQVVGGKSSNGFVIAAAGLPSTTINFNQPDGTQLSAYPGTPFTMLGGNSSDHAKYVVQSNGARSTGLNSGVAPLAIAFRDVGAPAHIVELEMTSASAAHSVIAAGTDASNYMRLARNNTDIWMVERFVAGASTNETPNGWYIPGSMYIGAKYALKIQAGKFQMLVNGLPYAKSTNWQVAASQQDIWYDLNAALPAGGTLVGLGGSPSSVRQSDNFRYGSLVRPIVITSIIVVENIEDDVLVRRLRLTGTCAANALNNAEVAILSSAGVIHSAFTAATGAPGAGTTFTIDSQPITDAMQGATNQIILRDAANHATADIFNFAVPIYQTITPYVAGMNSGFETEWSHDYRERNIINRVPFRYIRNDGVWSYAQNAPSMVITQDGQYTGYPSDAMNPQIMVPLNSGMLPGVYAFYYPAGMTVATVSLDGWSITTPMSGGYGEITVTKSSPGGLLRLSGTLPPEGYGPQNITLCLKSEATSTDYFSARFGGYAAATNWRIWRNMTPDDINTGSTTAMTRITDVVNHGGQFTGPLSPDAWAELSYKNGGMDLWINIRHDATDEYIEDFASELLVKANPLSKIYIEYSNETWNTASAFGQHFWFKFEGIKRGFYVSGTDYTPMPDVQFYINKVSGGILQAPVAAGDKIYYGVSGTGWIVAQAVTAHAIGDPVATTSNAGWTIIVTDAQGSRAGRRMLAERTTFMTNTFDAAFGKGRVIPVINWQASGLGAATEIFEHGDLLNVMCDPARTHKGRLAHAPYWGANLGVYDSKHTANWGATQKALLASTDPLEYAQGKTYFWAAADVAIDAAIAGAVTSKRQLAEWLVGKEKDKDAILLCSYECNWHVEWYGSVGDTWPAHIRDRVDEMINSPEMGAAYLRYGTGLKTRVGGEHVWFDRVSRVPSSAPDMTSSNNSLRTWGISNSEEDTTSSNYRLTAILSLNS